MCITVIRSILVEVTSYVIPHVIPSFFLCRGLGQLERGFGIYSVINLVNGAGLQRFFSTLRPGVPLQRFFLNLKAWGFFSDFLLKIEFLLKSGFRAIYQNPLKLTDTLIFTRCAVDPLVVLTLVSLLVSHKWIGSVFTAWDKYNLDIIGSGSDI